MRLIHARCFLRHLKAGVLDTEVPGPSLLPHPPRPKPRLYSNEEITKLQQATSQLWKPGSISQRTLYLIIGLLAGTGLRAGQGIALTVDDVRLDSDPPQLHIRKAKRISPHVIRHSTAMRLLQSRVEIAVIALWLGHESLDTTHRYIQADLKTKEQALEKLQAVAGAFPSAP